MEPISYAGIVSPAFLEKMRSLGKRDRDIADAMAMSSQGFKKQYDRIKQSYGNTDDAITAFLNVRYYNDVQAPQPQSFAPQPQEDSLFRKTIGGINKVSEYIASPINAASGIITKGIGAATGMDVSASGDVQNLDKNASMARTSLPLTAGLATAPLSIPAAAVATGIAGFAGRGLNETSDAITGQDQQSIAGRVIDSAKEGVKVGATDFLAGKALGLVGRAGKRLLSPLASRFDSEIAAIAERSNIELPLSSLSKSNVVQQVEALSQKGIYGKSLEETLDQATSAISQKADDLVRSFGGSEDLTIAGKSIIDGADQFRQTWRASKNTLYKKAEELIAKQSNAFVPDTTSTIAVIDEILSGKQSASQLLGDYALSDATVGILTTLRKNLAEGTGVPLKSYVSTLNELNKMTKFGDTLVSTGDQAILKKVIATLDDDVAKGMSSISPEISNALTKADNLYKAGIEELDSRFGDKIARLSQNPTQLVDALIKSNSVDDIPRIFGMIGTGEDGAKRIADVQSAFVSKLIKSATGDNGIMGRTLQRKIDSYGESTIRAIMGDDAFQILQDIQKLSSAVGRGQSVAAGSQTAFLAKLQAFFTALFTGNIPIAAGIVGGDKVLAELYKTNAFRTWLTKGLSSPPALDAAAGLAGEALQRATVYGSQQLPAITPTMK